MEINQKTKNKSDFNNLPIKPYVLANNLAAVKIDYF